MTIQSSAKCDSSDPYVRAITFYGLLGSAISRSWKLDMAEVGDVSVLIRSTLKGQCFLNKCECRNRVSKSYMPKEDLIK